jgi:hypothetical protein
MAARKPAKGPVVKAVEADLKAMDAAGSSLGATALVLARELDLSAAKAADIASCAKALRETLDRLRELSPPKQEKDGIDEVGERRATRRAARRSAS